MKRKILLILSMVGLSACIDTGQEEIAVPLLVQGTERSGPVMGVGDIPLVIDRADLAFGPLILCAGTTAGDLCETARAEWLDAVIVDTLAPAAVQVGILEGVSGPVLSWMYDLGISSQLTSERPYVLPAAKEQGSVSLVLEIRATIDGVEIPVSASVPIQQTGDTELGVPVVRKSLADMFGHDITGQEAGLTVRFDPATWVEGIDLSSFVETKTCETQTQGIVCNGTIELTCDGENETEQRDCTVSNQFCQRGVGCSDGIVIDRDSQPYRSIRNALLSGVRPTFTWTF